MIKGHVLFIYFMCLWCLSNANFGSISLTIEGRGNRNDADTPEFKDICGSNATCVPISSCPLLDDLLDLSCFSSDRYFHRLNSLSCGHANNEDYVCCPSCNCDRLFKSGEDKCGQSMVRGVEYNGLGAHPWVARIGFTHKETGNIRFACSGSIISKRVILTAAHCALAKPEGYKLSTIVLGEYDIGRSQDCNDYFCAPPSQAIKVDNVIVHPGYEQKIFRHDIALIVLKEEIQFTVTAAPICLNDSPEVVLNDRASLVGWGKLSGQNNLVSRQQLLEVPLVTLETCTRIFGDTVPIHEGQLCAGGEEGRDACSGFGGSPLVVRNDDRSYQIGIVSFGSENCGSEGVPSVYTNVAHYYRWIIENSPS